MSEEYPRGRDTSNELVEVRTVLSRAKHAAGVLRDRSEETRPTQWDAEKKEWYDYIPSYEYWPPDPDRAEMLEAMDQVVELLDRWRRTGRGKPS